MHVLLKPSSHDDLDPIEITGALFAIGRQEPPFNTYDNARIAKLSRRHARLFEQDGKVYLADLGSLNGTSCNGRPIKHQPVALSSGDVIEFGGLAFEAEITEEDPAPSAHPSGTVQRLVLTPERHKDTLEPIAVSSFPFLFDKTSDVFARHKVKLKDSLVYMSRHHAHIFLRDDELYIEDLGSTNGTYVSGVKLDERARQLEDGDLIALGTDRLTYSVHLLRAASEGTTQIPSGIEALENPTRTIFVDAPTSFLDVYFVDDCPEGDVADSDNGAAADDSSAGRRGRPNLVGQISRSFFDGPVLGPNARRGIAGGVLILAAGAGIWYVQGRELRAIEAAMKQEDYARAAALAQQHLDAGSDDRAIRNLATQAAVLQWVPLWQSALESADHQQAIDVAQQAMAAVRANHEAHDLMALLEWSAQVRGLLSGPADSDINQLMVRAHEEARLLDWWQSDSFTQARRLDRLGGMVPEFKSVREQVYSDVRQLRSDALDHQPLLDLDRNLEAALERDDLSTVAAVIDTFIEDHPQFSGRRALSQDLARLERLMGHIDAAQWLSGIRQLRADPFVTTPFAEHGSALARQALPDAAALVDLEQARRLWHAGDLDGAMERLDALAEGRWPGLGDEYRNRYGALLAGYRALTDARGETDYAERLFQYYATLDEQQDGHLISRLEQEFTDHADIAVERGQRYLRDAQAAWSAYQASGGIQPEHRLDQTVSDDFETRARALKKAAESLGRSERIFSQVAHPLPDDWVALESEVSREAAFQRGQLRNLAFHEPEVQERMLGMLPKPP